MQKNWSTVFALFLSCLIISLIVSRWLVPFPPPAKKPVPPAPSQPSPTWVMVINLAKQQLATAYTESPGSRPTASGQPYRLGSVAVHPKTPGGNPLDPIIPFGTTIHLLNPGYMTIGGQKFTDFEVTDTGDVNWSLRGESPFWIDVYYGPTSNWTFQQASQHGVTRVDFYWFHLVSHSGQAD